MAAQSALNVTHVIDQGPVSRLQVTAIVLCSFVAFLDGLDSQSIAVAAPVIAEGFGLPRSALGPIFSAALFGAMLGALTFGPLGDRFGRKRMLIAAAMTFGVFTMLTAFATSYAGLLAVRFGAGLGLGGATPCFIALASEYAPRHRRAMVASLIWAAFPLGALAGGFLNAYILLAFDWHTMFLVGGALPVVVALALVRWLPESLRYLLARRDQPAALRIARAIDPAIPAGTALVTEEERVSRIPVLQLFTGGRGLLTVLLWIPFITAFGTLGIIAYWTPSLLRESGISPSETSLVLGLQSVGSLVGMASAGRLMERFGAMVILVGSLVLGAAATAAVGFVTPTVLSVSAIEAVACLFVGMGASGSIALATLVYPTAMRSSGVGWAMGMGRGGQVCATLLAGVLVGLGWHSLQVFFATGLAPAVGALGVLAVGWQMRRPTNDRAGTALLTPSSTAV